MSADNQWKARHLREGRELLRNSIERMKSHALGVETCDASADKALQRMLDKLEVQREILTDLIDEAETIYGQRSDHRGAIQRARQEAWGQSVFSAAAKSQEEAS